MAKFSIECPHCGRYAEANTGFFARKKINCSCGNVINVRTDKLASRECPHCGNTVVFDQSKGDDAVCPVCHGKINTMSEKQQLEEFSCEQCGVRLATVKSAATYVCPVCDHENDVQERLTQEKIKKDGLASIIKYEGDNETLVWKHPIEDFNLGSQLIVHESQEAIFFRDGQALDLFKAGRYTLETQQLPLLEKVYQLPTDTEGTFHSEVYYINMATQMGIKWGTDSKVRLFDPKSGLHVELGASGEFNIRVVNSRKLLLKVVGTTGSLDQEQILGGGNNKGYFRSLVMTQVKSYLAQTIKENKINILEIDSELMRLSLALRDQINVYLDDYGLSMPEFFVNRIVTPDDDPNFRRMKEQYAEQYLLVRQEQIRKSEAEAAAQRKEVEATTAARMKIIGAQGEAEALKMKAQAEAEAYRMQAEAEAMEMKMKGYTYQQETARQVGLEAMKNGIGGGEGGGALGDIAGLGISLGAMGSVIGMTKEAMSPIFEGGSQIGQSVGSAMAPETTHAPTAPAADAWDCAECGAKGITSKFCPECGSKRPEAPSAWDCAACGTKGITSKFCPECGAKRPEAPTAWDCPDCGTKGVTGKFCPECGRKRGE
ncbi:MAG: SPFH domain-containing protein [Oscillospiraceae bacterium]|nr:SPFH domain-containing protein [Oscillospiraceae bacterium]